MRRVVIFGATSAIAQETAKLFAARGDRIFLVARDPSRLEAIAADLQVRGAAQVAYEAADLDELERHRPLLEQAEGALDGLDTALIAHGTLGDQRGCEEDFDRALQEFQTNLLSPASILTHLANRFEAAGAGSIAVISSVAGDRGRQSNYVYGAAKAGLTAFSSGMRNRLHRRGVHLLTIKPGFVDTPMTAQFPKGPLFVAPQVVARGIVRAIDKRRSSVYLPWFWRPIMAVIRAIPEPIFKRLSL